MGAECGGVQKILELAGRQKNDKKQQLFVKGNLRQAQSPGPNLRLVWSQGRGPPKVRDSRGRQRGALGPTAGWAPSPMCSNNWHLIPLPGPSPCFFLPLFCSHFWGWGLLSEFPLSILRSTLTCPGEPPPSPFLIVILATFSLNSCWHVTANGPSLGLTLDQGGDRAQTKQAPCRGGEERGGEGRGGQGDRSPSFLSRPYLVYLGEVARPPGPLYL